MAIIVKPLSPALGAEVLGLDLRDELDAGTRAALSEAWHRYQVLCFPGQKIAASDQIRFCGLFGDARTDYRLPPSVGRRRPAAAGAMLVSNIRHDGEAIGSLPDGGIEFHADGAHKDVPYMATSLYAIKVPTRGGETLFADMYGPLRRLARRDARPASRPAGAFHLPARRHHPGPDRPGGRPQPRGHP